MLREGLNPDLPGAYLQRAFIKEAVSGIAAVQRIADGNIRARGSQQQFRQPRSRPAVDAQAQFIPPALGVPRYSNFPVGSLTRNSTRRARVSSLSDVRQGLSSVTAPSSS